VERVMGASALRTISIIILDIVFVTS
jgi:hypothetical protein